MDRRNALKSLSIGVGYTMTAPALAALMSSCKQKSAEPNWKPEYFSTENYNTINELSEVLLPKTDTPGAKDVGVGPFIDKMVAEVFKEKDREKFGLGLEVFNRLAGSDGSQALQSDQLVEMMDKYIVSPTDEERAKTEELMKLEDTPEGGDDRDAYLLHSFLTQHKELSIMGYYGSEEIGENHLTYLPVPGPYQGCIDVETVGKAWSL